MDHKTHINKYKRIGIIQSALFKHKKNKMKINNKISGKYLSIWKLNSTKVDNLCAMVERGYLKGNYNIF